MKILGMVVAASLIGVLPARAAEYLLTYNGHLSVADSLTTGGGANLISGPTPFIFKARFLDTSPNIVGPNGYGFPGFRGFVAYAPLSATIDINNVDYVVHPYSAADPSGVAVALFDTTNPFQAGLYGAGFIANPIADGAGVVGDFSSATPTFATTGLTPTVFSEFNGAGHNAGPNCSPGPHANPCAPTPIALTAPGGAGYSLGFGGVALGSVGDTATLSAVPEPATWAMLILGMGAMGAVLQRRKVTAPATA